MWQSFCELSLKLMGWKVLNGPAPSKKAILIGAPHTSAWDFIISYLYYASVGGVLNTVIKKEYFFWPIGILLKKLGGIPIDRSRGVSVIKQIIQEMNSKDTIHLAITPEGTRQATKRWKGVFHAISKATGATVYLSVFDFGRKEVGWIKLFELTNDVEDDLRRIKAFYREYGVVARHPELFTSED